MYDTSQTLFLYRPLFMATLLFAEALFAARLSTRRLFGLRLAPALILCFGASVAYPLPASVSQTPWYSALMFLTLFAVSAAGMAIVMKGSVKNIVFCSVAGYTVQHIAQETYELLNIVMGLNGELRSDFYADAQTMVRGMDAFVAIVFGATYIVVYFAAFMVFGRKFGKDVMNMKNSYMIALASALTMIDVVFSSFVTYASYGNEAIALVTIAHAYNIVCCVFAMFLLLEIPKRARAEGDLAAERSIRHREQQQYHRVKENIDLINMKCHDLKHRIRSMKEATDINDIADAISVYDSSLVTGNEALDVIITEKSLLCRKQEIRLSCIADGEQLSFMKDEDIYSLFGNILDNAIEATEKLPASFRTVSLSVRRMGAFVIVTEQNPYSGELTFERGLPVTSKEDKLYHGFGMKSIRHVVDKYEGEMKIKTTDGIFEIDMAFMSE